MAAAAHPLSPCGAGESASALRLFVTVGTAPGGFDRLVGAADRAARDLGLSGFAQIGDGTFLPRHLSWTRFLDAGAMRRQLAARPVVVCHGGMGILGEALRAGCRVVCVPRDEPTSRRHPSNDQRAFVEALAVRLPICVCRDPEDLPQLLARLVDVPAAEAPLLPQSDVPEIIAAFLARDRARSGRDRAAIRRVATSGGEGVEPCRAASTVDGRAGELAPAAALERRTLLDAQQIVDDVGDHATAAHEEDAGRLGPAGEDAEDHQFLALDGALDPPRFPDRDEPRADVAIHPAVDVDVTLADEIALDVEIAGDDRGRHRCAARRLPLCREDEFPTLRAFPSP